MAASIKLAENDILLAVDVQNDFCAGGALAVPDGDSVIPAINRLGRLFPHVAMTQDWHPRGHVSFAGAHPGRQPFQMIDLPYGEQKLWPDHCVQSTPGADFHPALDLPHSEVIIRKGFRRDVDSYSAFFENDHRTATGLAGYLRERGFARAFMAGLATDYCVRYSALDARRCGFDAVLIEDACRAISAGPGYIEAIDEMRRAGIAIVKEADLSA